MKLGGTLAQILVSGFRMERRESLQVSGWELCYWGVFFSAIQGERCCTENASALDKIACHAILEE